MNDSPPIYNPYDFANPVADMALLADRAKEREEIDYYLTHASSAPRPINIALIGNRASGKTSLLNYTDQKASSLGFFTARINLDSNVSSNPLSFFYAILDSIIQKACQTGFFNGIHGQVYQTYLDLVSAYNTDVPKEYCLFLFPMRFAKAMQANLKSAEVPNNVIQHDLEMLRNEIARPIVLIFDECNTMILCKELLQKLRNIFMNLPGFMLVFAGTEELFPLMDDVFSPIIRQFKKINVREFVDVKDTRECIRRPLESLPGNNPNRYFDFRHPAVSEIHELTAGRPYEIQLLCHAMFKHLQEARLNKMSLSLAVLDNVRRELASTQKLSERAVLTTVASLGENEIAALNVVGLTSGAAKLEDIWKLEYLFHGTNRWTRETLKANIDKLVALGVLREENDIVHFEGDDFDKIYIKYFFAQKKKRVSFMDFPPAIAFIVQLFKELHDRNLSLPVGYDERNIEDIGKVISLLSSREADAFSEDEPMAATLYRTMIEQRDASEIKIEIVQILHPWGQSTFLLGQSKEKIPDDLFGALQVRLSDVGGGIAKSEMSISVLPTAELVSKIMSSKNERIRSEMADYHAYQMYDAYLERHDLQSALVHAELAITLGNKLSSDDFNSIGYVFLAGGRPELAEKKFLKAIDLSDDNVPILPSYNLAMALVQIGKIGDALEKLDWCAKEIEKKPDARLVRCLFIPVVKGAAFAIDERMGDVDVNLFVAEARQILLTQQ
jgi:tetratricopeptide (TPR) repeat protein